LSRGTLIIFACLGLEAFRLFIKASAQHVVFVRNAIKRVFHELTGERSRLMSWLDPSPAQSLSLVVV